MQLNGTPYPRDGRQPRLRQLVPLILFVLLALPAGTASTQSPQPIDLSRATQPLTAPLSLQERITCQTAIEQVYWRHRIWPDENPGPKPPLEAVMPPSAIQAKVEDGLRQSNALAALWQQPISGRQLQAEMARMASQTRQPEMLRQLWMALGDDPYLVAECLARPLLAQRLLENWYRQDERFVSAEQPFNQWWQVARATYNVALQAPAHSYALPSLAASNASQFDDDAWVPTPALPAKPNGTAVWTGTEMIIWGGGSETGGQTDDGSRYNPATDSWLTTSTVNAPLKRTSHSAIWTGTEMIVWGGCRGNIDLCAMSNGGRYNPTSDTWAPVSETNDPSTRMRHTAIWTGTEMIIWGGCDTSYNGCKATGGGGRYDPASDTWTPVSQANAPEDRYYHTAIWTGTEMIIWGGYDGLDIFNSGGRYDPASDTWTPTSTAGAPIPRYSHTAVWTGTEMIVWGGCLDTGCPFSLPTTDTGGRYDPASDTWTPTSTAGAPSERSHHTAVWMGTEMIVWGGSNDSSNVFNTGGRYDPATDSWTPTSTASAPIPRFNHMAVWTGTLMIVWGGNDDDSDRYRSGGRYDPVTDSWTPTGDNAPESFHTEHTAVWTGVEMIAWGGLHFHPSNGVIYNPATRTWRTTSSQGEPFSRSSHTAIWTGLEMIVWGGGGPAFVTNSGGRYNPASDTWTPTSEAGAPEDRADHSAVWTGDEMIVWGGYGDFGGAFETNTGSRYNPVTDSWVPITTADAPAGRADHTAVWSGDEMIVWGGYGDGSELNSGGRYDLSSDSWQPTSTANAPLERQVHTAVWTGQEMIVWGGRHDLGFHFEVLNSGGRYDPASDTWAATSLANVPEARYEHTVVWTGQEMIVWGGITLDDTLTDYLNTGSRYDPVADSWHATAIISPIASAPAERDGHTAVWTGQEMIVWGGGNHGHTGAHYIPNVAALPALQLSLGGAYRQVGDSFRIGARIVVEDESGAGVSNATVEAEITTPTGATFFPDLTTNANGIAQVAATTDQTGAYFLCVRSASKGGLRYSFIVNEESCITVVIP